MPSRRAARIGALALALGLTPLQPVAAAPMAPLPPELAKAAAGSAVTQVRRYRSFRGLMAWSVNWDRFANFDFSRNHRTYLNSLPPP